MRPSSSKIMRRKYNDCLLQLDALRAGRPNAILRGGHHADEGWALKLTHKHLNIWRIWMDTDTTLRIQRIIVTSNQDVAELEVHGGLLVHPASWLSKIA